jgi:hypothetical protein
MPHDQLHPSTADFRVTYHGLITTITPLTEACHRWLDENVDAEGWQWFPQRGAAGNALAVEPRYIDHVVEGMVEEGLTMEDDA